MLKLKWERAIFQDAEAVPFATLDQHLTNHLSRSGLYQNEEGCISIKEGHFNDGLLIWLENVTTSLSVLRQYCIFCFSGMISSDSLEDLK